MSNNVLVLVRFFASVFVSIFLSLFAPSLALATPFTMTTPGPGIALPNVYPEAGGVAIVMVGDNGNVYYQFSDPDGAFRGYQYNGTPSAFRGNPFTINDPIPLDCGVRTCSEYFGGGIATMYVRFSAYDGDTQVNGFDEDDIDLVMNGVTIGNWSDITTQKTNNSGTTSYGNETGFGNNSFNTGWFTTTNQTLLDDVLTSLETSTQVYDADPNDNYWDFRRGDSLGSETLRTIAPGYEFEKTADLTEFSFVGEEVTYTYTVTNIGSVDITNLTVSDDKIPSISCDKTSIAETTGGGPAEVATCTGTYFITQEDFDAQQVVNVANALGTPAYGQLGAVTDSVTLPGPAVLLPELTMTKVASPTSFSSVGEQITYTYSVENTGDATVTGINVTDNKIPGVICSIATLNPTAPGNTATCTGTYTVTQDDIDAFINSDTQLSNEATATGQDPNGAQVLTTATEAIDGPVAAPAMTVEKTALQSSFDTDGDTLDFEIAITNTGNVTWPAAPTITDALITDAGGSVTCPSGTVAVNATITCTASYAVDQDDLDAEQVENIADVSITIDGVLASGQGSVVVPATVTTGLDIVKQLPAGAAQTFAAAGDTIAYEYVLTNSGTVTLFSPSVTDNKVSVSCPAGPIAPGGTLTCTSSAPYPVTQPDLDAGSVTNTASASATTQTSTQVDSPETSLTVNADQTPELTLEKTAPVIAAQDFAPGLTVTYSYEVFNTGNVTITDPITVTDDQIAGPIDCGTAPLAPNTSRTCTANYTVTPLDVAAGSVTNRATASDGSVTSNEDSAIIPQEGTPSLALEKSADVASFDDVNNTIDYTFTVTNDGDTVIVDTTPITINDAKIATVDCATNQPAVLGIGASFTCSGTYGPVSQAEIDAGEVVNTATAQFDGPNGVVLSPTASATVPSSIVPAMSLVKTGPASFGDAGTTVSYDFALTNDSAQTIASASVTDPMIPALSCDFTDIAPNATVTCQGTYTVTQDDLDLGVINNTASATGLAPTGENLTASDTETTPVDPAEQISSLVVTKSADPTSFTAVGEVITYSFAVENTGQLTLEDVLVEDSDIGLTCLIAEIARATTDTNTCSGTYTITQDDIDAGSYQNSVTATAAGGATDTTTETVTGPARTPAFTIEKTADDTTDVVAGQVITYTYLVENTGNVTLTNVSLSDEHTSATGVANLTISNGGMIAQLVPGEQASLTSTYTVTQDDIDAGNDLTNVVTGNASTTSALTVPTVTDTETVDVADPAPALIVAKTENDGSGDFSALPTTETFSFEVTNTGNVTLSGFQLTDDLTGFSCFLPDLAPGATTASVCYSDAALITAVPMETTYTVDQGDIDAGSLTNTVTVTDGTTTATDSVTLDGPTQTPSIAITKDATGGLGYSEVGDVISYSYVIENTGNVTLTGAFSVTDDKTSVTCPVTPAAGIAPLQTITCTATYAVTQGDLDAGSVLNTADASTVQSIVPGGPTPIATQTSATEEVFATQSPSLTIEKALNAASAISYAADGDTISYDFTITNDGNVTIPAPILVDDDKIGTDLACSTAPLLPGDSVICTHVWTADQPAVDAGSTTNTATADAVFNGSPVPTDSDSVTVPAVQTPELTLTKTFDSVEDNSFAPTKEVTYFYTVENTGNTTITSVPTIADNVIDTSAEPLDGITLQTPFPAGGLPPGGSLTYKGTYTLTIDDVSLASVTNTATATSGGVVSNPSSVTTPENVQPALTITKTAGVASFDETTGTITYTYVVENTSEGSVLPSFVSPILITDDKIPGTIDCTPADGVLEVGETSTCSAVYPIDQDDLDADEITNSAVASTVYGTTDVFSPADQVTVPGDPQPALDVAKTIKSGPVPAEAGDTLTFEFLVTNTGNQTLSNVAPSDPLLPSYTCTVAGVAVTPPVALAPDAVLLCEGDYDVTQDDVDAQSLSNTASATGVSPQGTPVSDSDTIPVTLPVAAPELTVTKDLISGTSFEAVDEEMIFAVTVVNSGNVTLETVDVTDDLAPGVTCTIGPLAPGESDATCQFTYFTSQGDIDNGELLNTARANGTPTNAATLPPEEAVGTLTVPGPPPEPEYSLVKTADQTSFSSDSDTLTYTYTIANTGNVTLLVAPTLTDDKIPSTDLNCDPFPAAGLAPLEFFECTGSYNVGQPDLDAGSVTNIASVTSSEVPTPATDTATVDANQMPGITVDKQVVGNPTGAEGETITYNYLVTNTGNVTLSNIALTDEHTNASGVSNLSISSNGEIAELGPDEFVTLSATYVITQEDVDAGNALTNVVSLTSESPDGTTPEATDNESVDVEAAAPELDVVKTIVGSPTGALDEEIVYQITVTNTGNVTLSSVELSDDISRVDGSDITPDLTPGLTAGDGGTLSPDEIWTYELRHTITQDDIDAGGLSNTATATALAPDLSPVEDDSGTSSGTDTPTELAIDATPGIDITKTVSTATTLVDETVTFEITVTNTGNVTLTGVTASDDGLERADGTPLTLTSGPTFDSATQNSAAGTLLPQESATYYATYTLLQEDVDAGGIANSATAEGTPPGAGTPVDDSTVEPAVQDIPANPEISFEKRLAQGSGPTYDTLGETLEYEFVVTNEGNVTLTDPIQISDPRITQNGATISCPQPPLAPGAEAICTASYEITQTDLNDGQIENTATATVGDAAPVEDTLITEAVQVPALEMTKTADPIAPEDFIIGAEIDYVYEVTNSGNITLTDAITVSDNKIDSVVCDPLPQGGLPPTEKITCAGTYTLTQVDVDALSVTNLATASSGATDSAEVSETVTNDGDAALMVAKELIAVTDTDDVARAGDLFVEVGDKLVYEYTVTNSGQVSFVNGVDVNDDKFTDPIACYTPDASNPDLIPGEEITCQATYLVTQDDLDAGIVTNTASAATEFGPGDTPVESPEVTENAFGDPNPALLIEKSVDPDSYAAEGDILTYTITVTNFGNQTLTDVVVTDPLLPDLTCSFDTLDVGASETCMGSYEIDLPDINAGSVVNTASGTAKDPDDGTVTDDSDPVTSTGPDGPGAMTLVKTADPNPFGAVGTDIVYTFSVTNDGPYTLTGIEVTDPIDPDYSCTIDTLDPPLTDSSCTLTYTVTQDDVDAGEIPNTASAAGTDPFDRSVETSGETTTPGPDPEPSLEAVKTATTTGSEVDDVITYTLEVTNTGNVTLYGVGIDDTMTRIGNAESTALDAPFELQSGDINDDGELDVGEVWIFEARYTLTQDDLNGAGVENTATVTATDPNDTEVEDVSDDGDSGNGDDNPTLVSIDPAPSMDVVKTVVSGGFEAGDEVLFRIEATNTGNVDLLNVNAGDTLTRLGDGTDLSGDITGPTRVAPDAGATVFAPGDVWAWEVSYTLQQEDVDAGGIENVATVAGETTLGDPVTQVSSDDDDTDGNPANDPTQFVIPPTPELDVVKTVTSGEATMAGEVVTFEVAATNIGNVTITGADIADTLTNADGTVLAPDSISPAVGSDVEIAVDDTEVWTITYTLQQDDIDAGGIENTATISGEGPGGIPVEDVSDNGDDTDGNDQDDPTVLAIAPDNTMIANKSATVPERVVGTIFRTVFTITLENAGNVTQEDISIADDLAAWATPATLVDVSTPVVSGFETASPNTGFNGAGNTETLAAGAELLPGQTGTVELTVEFDIAAGAPVSDNTAAVTTARVSIPVVARASVATPESAANIEATKTVSTAAPYQAGQIIDYVLTFQNLNTTAETDLTLVDELPSGMIYVDGSSTPAPVATGRVLEWPNVSLAAGETITLAVSAQILDSGGTFTNMAFVRDANGAVVSNAATASISITPEAVFDCSDVIGKVFDDQNANGYQDPPPDPRAAISDQTYYADGKYEIAPEVIEQQERGEPGLPGVRLVTVRGDIITTDAFGRFSVPCAMLPSDTGANFTLKLDDRSLPTGYNLTTENPRTMRLTSGIMTEMNFGARLSNLVDIDLLANAFEPGSATPTQSLETGVDGLVAQIAEAPSVLRLTYYRADESTETARARLNAVERLIRNKWRGPYRLRIETTIARVQ